jgi:hypothetical protein
MISPPRIRRTRNRERNNNNNNNNNIIANNVVRALYQNNNNDNNNNNNNLPNINTTLIKKQSTKAHLLEKSPIIEKNKSNISFHDYIEVYDYESLESLEVNPLNIDKEKVIFKASNSYFQYPKELFGQHIELMDNILFECKLQKQGAPIIDDIKYDVPYYLLRGSGNFVIPLSDILYILSLDHRAYEIKKTDKHLTYTTALESVLDDIVDGETYGLLGQSIDIMSADHCQSGTSRDVYELFPIEFHKIGEKRVKRGGDKTRKNKSNRFRRKLKKTIKTK